MKKTGAAILVTVLLVSMVCAVAVAEVGILTQTGSCVNYLWAGVGPRRASAEQHADCSLVHTITYSTTLSFNDGTAYAVPTNKCDRIAPGAATGATGNMRAMCEICSLSKYLTRSTSW